MRKTLIYMNHVTAVSTSSSADNFWRNVIVNERDRLIQTFIEELPKTIPCSYYSREFPEGIAYTASVCIYFLLDDEKTYLIFRFQVSGSTSDSVARYIDLDIQGGSEPTRPGSFISAGRMFLLPANFASGQSAETRFKMDLIYNNSYLRFITHGITTQSTGIGFFKVNYVDGFPAVNKWLVTSATNLRIPGSTSDYGTLFVTSLPWKKYGTDGAPEIIKLSNNAFVRNREYAGVVGDDGDIIVTSSLSRASGVSSNFPIGQEVVIDGVKYYVNSDSEECTVLVRE